MGEQPIEKSAVRLVIPSRVHLIDMVHSVAEQLAGMAGFDEDDALNVGIAVREAVINAMLHGNGQNPDLNVEMEIEIDEKGLRAKVCDEGGGFDPTATPDPTDEDHLLDQSGRGLLMMKAFVDDVVYDARDGRGMQVTLTKHRKG